MMILKATEKNAGQIVRATCSALDRGVVIAYPTETSYGLGCDPRNTRAVAKIFRIKGREKKKSLLLVASSIEQVKRVAILSKTAEKMARRYWPGALTLIVPARSDIRFAAGTVVRGEIAVRVSSSPIVQKITTTYGFPIVSTSANISGEPACTSGRAVIRVFVDKKIQPDIVIDAGALPRRMPSTIVRVDEEGRVDVIRKGAVRMISTSYSAGKKRL